MYLGILITKIWQHFRFWGTRYLNCCLKTSSIEENCLNCKAQSVLSISFEVDFSTGKVGGSLLIKRQRHPLPRGVWGYAPPRKFSKFRCLGMLFSPFSRQYLGLKNNQNQDYINHNLLYVYYNRSFPQSQSLAFRKE